MIGGMTFRFLVFFLFSVLLSLGQSPFFWWWIVYWQQILWFSQPTYTSQLFCPWTYVPVSFASTASNFSSLQIDLPHKADVAYGLGTSWTPNWLNIALRNPSQTFLWQQYFRVIANANQPWQTNWSWLLWSFIPQPLVFMRSSVLDIADAPQSRIMDTQNNNILQNAGTTTLLYTLWPCVSDIVKPVISFNSARHTNGYTQAQTNTINYDISLTDLWGGADRWFVTDPWQDQTTWWRQSWAWYTNTAERWSGISSWSRNMTIAIQDEAQTSVMTRTRNDSFVPYDRTRNWLDKNYTTDFSQSLVWSGSFPIEKQVTITATVSDRAWNTSSPYRVDFNHGADPWLAFGMWEEPTLSCGNLSDNASLPWATIRRTVEWFTVPSFDLYAHDDRAGIDQSSVTVTFSWMLTDGTLSVQTFDINDPELTLTPFSRSWQVLLDTYFTPWTQKENISSSSQNRNYRLTINNPTVYWSETPLDISFNYTDLRSPSRVWKTVSCSFDWSQASPQNESLTMIIERTPFPDWWQIRPMVFTLTDNRAWVSLTGSTLTISWFKLSSWQNSLVSVTLVYDQTTTPRLSDLITRQFTTSPSWVIWWQPYNYDITFSQTWVLSLFSWYFAPEQPITARISYVDRSPFRFANNDTIRRDLPASPYLMANNWLSPFIRQTVFPLDVFLTTPLWQYPYNRSIRDDRASMLPNANLVRFVWRRRWYDVAYEYRTPTSTLSYTNASPSYQWELSETLFSPAVTTNQALFPTMEQPTSLRQAINLWPHMYFDYNALMTISIAWSDKRVTPFAEVFSDTRPTTDLVCEYGCSFDRLFFVWWEFPDDHPLTDMGGRYAPYTWQHVSVIWSWVIIDPDGWPDEWWLIICNWSWWFDQKNTLTFDEWIFRDDTTRSRSTTWVSVDYTGSVLYIADGEYMYSGGVVVTR